MRKKNLIMGVFSGYGIPQLKPWVLSINRVMSNNVEKAVGVGEASPETKQWLVSQGFRLFELARSPMAVFTSRFWDISEYLRLHWREYDRVITTDVKDVYFQKNPFDFLERHCIGRKGHKQLIVGSECLSYKNEPWNNGNLLGTYGAQVYELFKENEIFNSGVLAGSSEYIKDLAFNIYVNAVERPKCDRSLDQAVLNVLAQTQPFKDSIYFARQYEGWCCNAATTADPTKFEAYGPHLMESRPVYRDGKVYSSRGDLFFVVHQYDRVPVWKENAFKVFSENTPPKRRFWRRTFSKSA
jgi:hypothetical protein